MTERSGSSALTFASYTLDLDAGRLLRGATAIPLRPKTWAVLVYLIQRPGILISRDELLDAVWPDVAVTPDTLTKSVGELRTVFGDDVRQPTFIETVHRRGFRFLVTPRPVVPTASPAAALPSAFVGRDAELGRLEEAWRRACAGQRQMVFLSGGAGLGKSTLLTAFLAGPAVAAGVVGRGACLAQHGTSEAYLPVLEALERLARGDADGRVTARLRQAAPSWLAQMPWLVEDAALLQHALRAARPERMLREGVALCEALAAERPLLLVLEDLHWSDPATIDLLARLTQREDPARLLVVATYRPAEVAVHDHPLGGLVRRLRAQRRGVELPLHELAAAEVDAYLAARFPGGAVPAALPRLLHDWTDGHPLFLRALVDHLIAQGWILDTAPGWSFAALPARHEVGVPGDVRDLLALQIERLAPADRRLLEAASVAGRDAGVALLASALERPEDEVAAACDALARGGRFLSARVDAGAPCYGFVHELYRQAVYDDLAPARRQRLHLRIGRALEGDDGGPAGAAAAELARHFEHGGDAGRAIDALVLAAHRARTRGAVRDACGYLDRALAQLAHLPAGEDRRRRTLDLHAARLPVLYERYGPAAEECAHAARQALAAWTPGDPPRRRFEALLALAHVHVMRADADGFDALAPPLTAVAAELGTREARMLVDSVWCRAAAHRADYEACERYAEGLRREWPHGAGRPGLGADAVIASQIHAALAAWMRGRFGTADALLRDAASAASAPGTAPFTQSAVTFFGCLIAMLCGDPVLVEHGAQALLSAAREHDFALWITMALALRGWARVHRGEVRAGLGDAETAYAGHTASEARIFTTYMLGILAEGHRYAGDIARGLERVEEGLQLAARTLDRTYVPELWRLRAELLDARDGAGGAAAHAALQRAFETAREAGAAALALRAALALAQSRAAAEDRERLARALSGVEHDATRPDVRSALALLGPPSGRRVRRLTTPGS